MAHSSDTNLALDRSHQAGPDTPPASLKTQIRLRPSPTYTNIMASSSEAELTHDPSNRAGEDMSATSFGSVNVQRYEAPAVAAVLQTNELLHLILTELPREHRTSIRCVSKAWQAAVEKIGHVFEPEGHAACERPGLCNHPSTPLYTSHVAFRFHPALHSAKFVKGHLHASACIGESRTNYHRIIALGHFRDGFACDKNIARVLTENKHEFITSPPMTELSTSQAWRYPTILRVPGGVRFGHLLEHLLEVTHVDSPQCANISFATQLCNVEPGSETPDSSSEDEDEEEPDESGESEEADDSEEEDADDGAESSSESNGDSEEGDSKPGEDDQVESSSAAMDAVMKTNELLHLILGEVPLKYRSSIRRVSKTWQAAVVKIGHTLQPVGYNDSGDPLYPSACSLANNLATNDDHPMIICNSDGNTFYDFTFDPCGISDKPEFTERQYEFLTDPPVTQARLVNWVRTRPQAILRVPGGIRVRDLMECFRKMCAGDHTGRTQRCAYIAIQREEDGESDNTAKKGLPPAQDDPSQSGDESDADDSDESDAGAGAGAGGAGLGGFGEPDDGDKDGDNLDNSDAGAEGAGTAHSGEPDDSDDDDNSENDDAGGSSESDGGSEDGDNNSGEKEQVEESSAAAVLGTNELLHMILSEVPREKRTSLRRVSKNWKAAIEKIGHAVEPTDHEAFEFPRSRPLPLYTSHLTIRPNPLLLFDRPCVFDTCEGGLPTGLRIECHRLKVRPLTSAVDLSENEYQFATDPPLTELLIPNDWAEDSIPFRVNGGIRLKDLMRCLQASLGGNESSFCAAFGGPMEVVPAGDSSEGSDASEPDDDSEEGSDDDSDEEAGGDDSDEPADSGAPDGSSEKGDGEADEAGEDDQFESSSKVLQTNELLHMIIAEVPREQKISIRRVAKSWHAAVTKIGHALEPSEYEPSTDGRACDLPMYSPQMTFKQNPAFNSTPAWMDVSSRVVYLGGRIWCQYLSFYSSRSAAQLAEMENEFITDPPITQAKIHSGYISLDVLLHVRDGIRVRDLLQCLPELRYLKPTCVNVLFGDGTRRAKADHLYAIEGEVESDSAGEDDDSYEESEEEGDDGDVEMADSDDDDDSNSGEDDEAE